jgi:leucyl aminopeptidase
MKAIYYSSNNLFQMYSFYLLISVSLCYMIRPIPSLLDGTEIKPRALTQGPAAISKFPATLNQVTAVKGLISSVDRDSLKAYLVQLTQFPERYYTSDNGVKSAQWIKLQIDNLQSQVSSDVILTTRLFKHSSWAQPSVIARLESKINSSLDIVITGSHFDTAANGSPQGQGGNNPAADDCASGVSVVHETLRVLIGNITV